MAFLYDEDLGEKQLYIKLGVMNDVKSFLNTNRPVCILYNGERNGEKYVKRAKLGNDVKFCISCRIVCWICSSDTGDGAVSR